MIDFIIKSSVSLIVFLGFYHLLLEKEKMHFFNRFYLLGSVIISLLIPFLNFEIIQEVPVTVSKAIFVEGMVPNQVTFVEEEASVLSLILWILYGLITFTLFIRFGKNILKLTSKARLNPTVKYKSAKLVLVDEKIIPYTFLNFVFINYDDYNYQNIEDELYTHELVHVTQKHTLDILFIEIFKIIFWFNLLFYFYKKAIQLNHEFLADEGVIKSCDDVPFYQNLLLQKNSINHVFLTSNLNYLITKKRLIMMTKNTSKKLALLKKITILPMLIGLIYFFCVEIVAQEKTDSNSIKKIEDKIVENVTTKVEKNKNVSEDEYFKGVRIKYYDKISLTKKDNHSNTIGAKFPKLIFDKKYEELTKSEKKEIEIDLIICMQRPFEKKSPTQQELNEFKNPKKFAIWIDGKNVSNNELEKYNSKDFAHYSGSVILKNARTKKHPQPFQYWFYTKPYYEKNNMGKNIDRYSGKEIVIFKDGKNHHITPTEKSDVKAEVAEEVSDYMEQNRSEKLEAITVGKETDLTEPSFPGGLSEFYKFVAKNFKIPSNFKGKDKLIVSFIVEKDGSLTNIDVKKDLGFGTKEETIRVLKISPKWIPATVKNEKIRYQYVLPILIATK